VKKPALEKLMRGPPGTSFLPALQKSLCHLALGDDTLIRA
jgi:hypothetical protein